MNDSNRDLQAAHQLMSIFERSKFQLDELIDEQPAFFAIINRDGVIYRLSTQLAAAFGQNRSQCIGMSLADHFTPESWNHFRAQMRKLDYHGANSQVGFELPLDTSESLAVFWRLELLRLEGRPDLQLIWVSGQDISQLRRAERQLSEIFATTPIGILSIEANGNISPSYSAYCEWLFDTPKIAHSPAFQVIFQPAEAHLSLKPWKAVKNLFAVLGKSSSNFGAIKADLPLELVYTSSSGTVRNLQLSYHPVEVKQKLMRLLIIIEDRTEQIRLRQLAEESKVLEEETAKRILQIKRCKPELLNLLINDLSPIFATLNSAFDTRNWEAIKRALHGIKGNALIVDFSKLANISHEYEDFLKADAPVTPHWLTGAASRLHDLTQEWKECLDLTYALYKDLPNRNQNANAPGQQVNSKSAVLEKILERFRLSTADVAKTRLEVALRMLNSTQISEVEPKIRAHIEAIASEQSKEVVPNFQWNKVRVDEEVRNALSECFIHFINNSLVHGLENPAARASAGKPRQGNIGISCREVGKVLNFEIWDDGRGIDIEKIRSTAVLNQQISVRESFTLGPLDLMQLIFLPGLSSKSTVEKNAGRGIGLDAVSARIHGLGGTVRVSPRAPYGTQFNVEIPFVRKDIARKLSSLSNLVTSLEQETRRLNSELGLAIPNFSKPDFQARDYFFFGDDEALIMALSTIIADAAASNEIALSVKPLKDRVEFAINQRRSISRLDLPPEFSISLPGCQSICFQHRGEISRRENEIQICVGHLIALTHLPPVYFVIEVGVDAQLAAKTKAQILDHAHRFGAELVESPKPESGVKSLRLMLNPPSEDPLSIGCGVSEAILENQIVRALGHLLE